jgi:chromosomal replication initiator protein
MCTSTTISPEEVIDIICQFYELDVEKLVKRKETGRHHRSKEYVKGRQFFAYWMMKNTELSQTKVGRYLDGVDHSTISHSVDTVLEEMNLYSRYKKEIFTLNQLIQEREAALAVA